MKKLVLLSLFILMLATCLPAQETTASINGTISDATGAVVAKAQITVTSPSTGYTRSTVSGSNGDYNLSLLPPDTYTMKVQATGFATVEQKGITLLVGRAVTLNQTLKPGGANEVVEVTAAPPMIETTVSNVVGTVSPSEVSNLPILDRNFSGLETLIPGVRQAEGFDPTKTRVGNISVNGGDGRQVDTNVDGGDNKDLVVGGLVQNFTMEGIQEFNVSTNRYTAEAGHAVAAVVNVVTKSGTDTITWLGVCFVPEQRAGQERLLHSSNLPGAGSYVGTVSQAPGAFLSLRRLDWRSDHQGQALLFRRLRAEARAGHHRGQSEHAARLDPIRSPDRWFRGRSLCLPSEYSAIVLR